MPPYPHIVFYKSNLTLPLRFTTPRKRRLGEILTLTAAPATSAGTLESIGDEDVLHVEGNDADSLLRPRLRRVYPGLRSCLGRLPMDSLRWDFLLSFISRFSTQFVYIILSLRLKVIGFFSASLPSISLRKDGHA